MTTTFVTVLSVISTIVATILTVMNIYQKLSNPVEKNKRRIDELEGRMHEVELKLTAQATSLKRQERWNTLTLQALTTIMKSLMDPEDNLAELQECISTINKEVFGRAGEL